MQKRSADKLRKRFSNFFPSREFVYKSKTNMRPFSIGVGWGWHGILRRLCTKIESYLDNLPEDEQNDFIVLQVKEKFGGLRFYYHFQTEDKHLIEAVQADVRNAELESTRTCETCGLPGKIRQDLGWLKCMCFFHYNKEKALRRVFGPYYSRKWETFFYRNLRKVKEVLKWQQ